MGITEQIKNKLHSHDKSQDRPDDSEIQAALQHEANAQITKEPEAGAGAGVAIESFGGGPRFDNSGPGPQAHDFHGSNAQPQNPVGARTDFGRMEGGMNEDLPLDRKQIP